MTMHNPPHPGDFITEVYLEPNGLTGRQLALKLGVAASTLSRVLKGASGISPEMALRLSKALGRSPESWVALMATDKRALLALTSPAAIDLVPVRLVARETISELYYFKIDAVAAGTIDPLSMLNKPACISVNHGEQATRYFHGIIAEFGPAGHSPTETRYRMVLVPQLAQTSLRIDCRMFFNKTAQDIIKTIFSEAGVTKTAFRL